MVSFARSGIEIELIAPTFSPSPPSTLSHYPYTYIGAWQTAGAAVRGAIDLGLHRSPNRLRLSPLDKDMRRRVWWCCYGLEKVVSRPGSDISPLDDADRLPRLSCRYRSADPEASTTRIATSSSSLPAKETTASRSGSRASWCMSRADSFYPPARPDFSFSAQALSSLSSRRRHRQVGPLAFPSPQDS